MPREAEEKQLVYEKVDPNDAQQIEVASYCEREGFGTGLDPQELPPILQFLAKNGHVSLQYAAEDGQRVPTGVMELIPLTKALKYRPGNINHGEYDLSIFPFHIIMENQQRVFMDARRFAQDKDIIYHHRIAMSRKGGGYGTLLMRHVLETSYVKNRVMICFIDAAEIDEKSGELSLAPNEDSFTVHLRAGFVLAGVIDPPVYDQSLAYYCFIRSENIKFVKGQEILFNLANRSPAKVLQGVKQLVGCGYVGTGYAKSTKNMRFVLTDR
ncbi:MAG: hypothetical protein ABH841_01155 [Candidatus Nealsonbacteria bacterium]